MMRHCPDWYTDIEVARYYLSRYCLIHLNNDLDKVRLLAFMTRKLFRLSQNRGMVDNPDSPENHEALLPGTVKANLESGVRHPNGRLARIGMDQHTIGKTHPTLQNMLFIVFKGHLFQTFTQELLEDGMNLIVGLMKKEYKIQMNRGNDEVPNAILTFGLNQCPDFGKNINYLIATGNLRSKTGLGLQQMAGLVVTAEKVGFYQIYFKWNHLERAFG